MKFTLTFLILLLSAIILFTQEEQLCYDYLLLDGYEPLEMYGIDSTYNWWAVTAPFSNRKRLIVNGEETDVYNEIKPPVFSPDGTKWAAFVNNNSSWEIVTESGKLDVMATDPGELVYSGISNDLIYSYFESEMEYVVTNFNTFTVMNRIGKLYPGLYGGKVAFTFYQGDRMILNVNGKQYMNFNTVKPMGFWTDGSFMYAIQFGNGWEIKRGEEAVSETYQSISEVKMNRFGTVAAAICQTFTNQANAVLFADEYYEPVISNNFDSMNNLVIHPTEPMMAFAAQRLMVNFIVLNTVKYDGGQFMGVPRFSYDGSELYYIGCDQIDCFININGKELPIFTQFDLDEYFAVAPKTETMAYSTNATLMLRNITSNQIHAGMMTDEMGLPRFNWREGRYEALGAINNRLFMLTCYPN